MDWITKNNNVNSNTYDEDWRINWNLLVDGINEIYISVNDNAGNRLLSGNIYNIYVNAVYPTVSIQDSQKVAFENSPLFNKWQNHDPSYYLDVNYSDNLYSHLDKAFYQIKLNGITQDYDIIDNDNYDTTVNHVSAWKVDFQLLGQGTNDIFLIVSDNAGNTTTSYVCYILKDTTSPNWTPKNSPAEFNDWYNVTPDLMNMDIDFFDPEEIDSLLDSVYYAVVNSGDFITDWQIITEHISANSYEDAWLVRWDLLGNGSNDIYVLISDNAKNRRIEKVRTIKKDIIAPSYYYESNNNIDYNKWYGIPSIDLLTVEGLVITDDGYSLLDSYSWGFLNSTIEEYYLVSKNKRTINK